jgi:hypothetical protein
MEMNRPAKELLGKMGDCVASIDRVLRDNRLRGDVQADDVSTLCWAMVELSFRLKQTVFNDLSNLD